MKKVLEKEISNQTVIIAINHKKELKIGSEDDFKEKIMSSFSLDGGWYGVGVNLLHINENLKCNMGLDLPIDNQEFPFDFLSEKEVDMLKDL